MLEIKKIKLERKRKRNKRTKNREPKISTSAYPIMLCFQQTYLNPHHISNSPGNRRETALASNQRHPATLPHRTTRRRSRRMQAPPQNPPNRGNRILCFTAQRPELPAEIHVPVQGFFGRYKHLWSQNFVFHCFNAQPTYPSPVIPDTKSGRLQNFTSTVTEMYKYSFCISHSNKDIYVSWNLSSPLNLIR